MDRNSCSFYSILLVCLAYSAIAKEYWVSYNSLTDETTIEPEYEKVKLTVFYESLCPDCIDFFVDQLRLGYQLLNRNIILDLVPYGNAEQNFTGGHWKFNCQHGPLECEYNKLHACALKLIKQESKAYKFIACLMVDKNESLHLHKCATEYKIDIAPINKCRRSDLGDNLLAKYGNRTHSFRPRIQGVPTIAFNDVYTKKDQDDSMTNLTKVICRHLNDKPRVCEDFVSAEYNNTIPK